jgi:predicted nucleic acid-binding protein
VLIAADTNVLLDMALPRDHVHDAVALIRTRVKAAILVVLPTVIQELADISLLGDPAKRRQAGAALDSLLDPWDFRPINYVPVGHGITERIAGRILAARLLPEAERNDSLILAEAALADCGLLLTSDNHLLDIPADRLRLLLTAQDVGCPSIVSPQRVVRDFFPRRG